MAEGADGVRGGGACSQVPARACGFHGGHLAGLGDGMVPLDAPKSVLVRSSVQWGCSELLLTRRLGGSMHMRPSRAPHLSPLPHLLLSRINELCATTWIITGGWHMCDYVWCRLHEDVPKDLHLGQLLLDDVLVMRPDVMVAAVQAAARQRAHHARDAQRHAAAPTTLNGHEPQQHAPGGGGEAHGICRGGWHVRRPPTGRTLRTRVAEALPPLGVALRQYVVCEVLNAWLMQQSTGERHRGVGQRALRQARQRRHLTTSTAAHAVRPRPQATFCTGRCGSGWWRAPCSA